MTTTKARVARLHRGTPDTTPVQAKPHKVSQWVARWFRARCEPITIDTLSDAGPVFRRMRMIIAGEVAKHE